MWEKIIPNLDVDKLSPVPLLHRLRLGGDIIGVSDGSNPSTITRRPSRFRAMDLCRPSQEKKRKINKEELVPLRQYLSKQEICLL